MKLEQQLRSTLLTRSNPVGWWWGFLAVVSAANIAAWWVLYRHLPEQFADYVASTHASRSTYGLEVMMLLCAGYVFGCAFRSFLPRADVQRICLFDTWLSSVVVGRSVATVAELCFVAQWAVMLHQFGTMTGAQTVLTAAWVIVPAIVVAECLSWYAVLTTNYLGNAIENSLWAVTFGFIGVALCRLLPEFDGPVRVGLAITILGIAFYLAFLMTVDVPMYLNRWRAKRVDGSGFMRLIEGLRDVSTRWVVTHDVAEWKEEMPWMALYFSVAVWSSLALCVAYSLDDHVLRYRTVAALESPAGIEGR